MSSSASWIEQDYFNKFKAFTEVKDNVERISNLTTSNEEFIEKYEKPYKPVRKLSNLIYLSKSFNSFVYKLLGCDP